MPHHERIQHKDGPNVAQPSGPLDGKQVALCGRLASMTHAEAAGLVVEFGGRYVRSVGRKTDLLVVGQDGPPLEEDGRVPHELQKARDLGRGGSRIEILPEEDFLELLGLTERRAEVFRRYTAPQLCRLLGIRRGQLNRWVRAGLIRPVETVHRLAYFDFAQVADLKALCELTDAGVPLGRIRNSLEQLRHWAADLDRPLTQLALLEGFRKPLVRTAEGRLVEPTGQMLLGFDEDARSEPSDDEASLPIEVAAGPAGLFDLAVEHESDGRFDLAAATYQQILVLAGPDAEVCFNLANSLYAQGRSEAALERFRQAVELAPDYVEAWNNLANVLGELGQTEEAIEAFEIALRIAPNYADAHYNLAQTLDNAQRADEARPHWESYLRHDRRSVWSDYARRRLEETSP